MKTDKERDALDDLFRSKLQHFEVDTMPDDWDAIARRLPGKASIPFRHVLRYWAAAVIALLMTTGGIYLFKDRVSDPIAQEIERQTETIASQEIQKPRDAAVMEAPAGVKKTFSASRRKPLTGAVARTVVRDRAGRPSAEETHNAVNEPYRPDTSQAVPTEEAAVQSEIEPVRSHSLIAEVASVSKKAKTTASRKWGMGMGAGGFTAGTNNSVNAYALRSSSLQNESLMFMNAPYADKELPKTDIDHKTPISFGLSVSRLLNDRFALQTGLTYSYLKSDWSTNGSYHGETVQKLHFIGIPLSVSYKIAEWNRLLFYASAGGMTEVNVAGNWKTKVMLNGKEMSQMEEKTRMKEWLWSVNARAGVSYPLIRFVNAFAEVGAAYYFDNGSTIETIHSEKPFNVSLQVGLRLGF